MEDIQIKLPMAQLFQKGAIDETQLPNSVLNRQQANRFIDLVINQSNLLKRIRVSRVNHPKGDINKLDLGTIVTEGASAKSTTTTRTPTERIVKYDMEKYRSAFDLKTDFLEDNIEGASARDTLLNMFSKQIANNTEMAAIQGDDDLATGDTQSDSNNLLGVNDGFKKILQDNVPSGQQLDAAGKAASKKLYYAMKRLIPTKYRAALGDYVWIVSPGVKDKWGLDWSGRETAEGDSVLKTGLTTGPWGIPMLEVPLMPENLTYSSTVTDGTQIWLTPLQNLIYFIQRDITIEFDRFPRQDAWQITIHFRCDFQVENEDMVVVAKNLSLTGTDYT